MEKENNHGKTELLPPMTFEEITEDTIGATYHEILFMTGKEIRDRGDCKILEAYMRLRTLTDQN